VSASHRVGLGAVLLAVWDWHSTEHVLEGHASEVLWCCIMGELLLAVGLLLGHARLAGTGTLWLAYGLPLFFISVAQGEPKTVASWFTHLLGPASAVAGVRGLGLPRGTWWRAVLSLLGLHLASRFFTTPEFDVNMSQRVYPGWEGVFPNFLGYEVFLVLVACALFLVLELGLRRFVAPVEERAVAPAPQVRAVVEQGSPA
jgi:hypothetical protein